MSQYSPKLSLPYIAPAQAQKHVTHNEALRYLDGIVQLSVKTRTQVSPPATIEDGDRFLVASGAVGEWSGWDHDIAHIIDGEWQRIAPQTGWRTWVEDEGALLVFDGLNWISSASAALQNLPKVGIGTIADTANPFAAKLNAALWTARPADEGGNGNLFYTMNKTASNNDLGLILQSNYQTKAQLGLMGSDHFRLAVTQDGTAFHDCLIVDHASGIMSQPQLPRFKAYTNFDNFVSVGTWTTIAINESEYNDQNAFDPTTNQFTAPADGAYLFGASLQFKLNESQSARMRARLVVNGLTEIKGSVGEGGNGAHINGWTTIWLQAMQMLNAGDTVELQGTFRGYDGYFRKDHTTFWGTKIG